MSHSINVARSSPKIAVVVVQEIVLMWFRSVGRVVWVGNADGRGGGGGEDGDPEKSKEGYWSLEGRHGDRSRRCCGGGQGSLDNADHRSHRFRLKW